MTKSLCDSCVNKNCRWRAETVSNDPPVMDCTDFKTKITNADRIRSMTDEELARYLVVDVEAEAIRRAGRYLTQVDIEQAIQDCTDWLKKEATNNG